MAEKNIKGSITVEFTEPAVRTNIESGEDIKTIFGKTRKWFSSLKAVAITGSYIDLTDKPVIPSKVSELVNNMIINLNLLINGDFKIWQRGESITINSTTWTYTADRVRCKGTGTVTKVSNGMKFSGATNAQYVMEDADYSAIAGKTVTLSYSKNGIIFTSTFIANSAIVANLNFVANDVLNWWKLENGSIATPFSPRSRPEEHSACQWYYRAPTQMVLLMVRNSATDMIGIGTLPAPMRVFPTIGYTSLSFNNGVDAPSNITAISAASLGYNYFRIIIQKAGSLAWLGINYPVFDAEIYS